MALVIRLRQQGSKNAQTFRLVLTDKKAPRDGKYIEKLGWYNPLAKEDQQLHVDAERVGHWLNLGAQVTEKAKSLIKKASPEAVKLYSERDQKKRMKRRALVVKKKATAKK